MSASFRKLVSSAAVAAAFVAAAPAQALVINLTDTGDAQANAGFAAAAAFWQSMFADNVTVNITSGFAALAPNVLGQAGSTRQSANLTDVRNALAADATSADDTTMVNGMPAGAAFTRLINNTSTNAADHLQTGLTNIRLTSAQAKAVGLRAANDSSQDATITFSNQFAWDFDPTDGIGAGLIDFVGVAIHELGHAMGFVSDVDILDINGTAAFSDNAFAPFTSLLDFTRCSSASETAGADLDFRVGTDAKDFAIDGQCTALISDAWSTGVNFGDGRQASHWKDNRSIGIMDPTSAPRGVANVVTANDIRALDVIGWTLNTVPEPSSLLLAGAALFGLGAARRARRQA
jgi:hypothetical protein